MVNERRTYREVVITRQDDSDKVTPGTLSFGAWSCKTLELPDKGNASKISCIPKGVYVCEYTFSPSFQKFTYEIKDVPNRAGIRIHSGNYTRQILGCILLGQSHTDIDKDGIMDVTGSALTISQFEKLMNKEKFTLKIQ